MEFESEIDEVLSPKKRFLIGQLGSYGDCLYATTIARQIKTDYPQCHLTWAIGSIYRSILNGNPYVDEIWEVPLLPFGMKECWEKFEKEAIERKKRGEFDEVFLTQIYPNNYKNFDGTVRSSIFREYNKPITVPVTPIIRLFPNEIQNVREFVENNKIKEKKHVILFEASHSSGQSFVTQNFSYEVSKKLTQQIPDLCVIITSSVPLDSSDERIIDGSILSFRENAELTKYCTLLIGCSSGISWLCTSDWAKPLPMVQLLRGDTGAYASFVQDFKYHGINSESIIEMTECSANYLFECILTILNEDFNIARKKYHKLIRMNFKFYLGIVIFSLIRNKKFNDALLSLKFTLKRWIFCRPADYMVKY